MAASSETSRVAAALEVALSGKLGKGRVGALRRLSGGASQETWSFDYARGDETRALIMRRSPAGRGPSTAASIPLATEAALIERVAPRGVPVPRIVTVLQPADGLGSGFVMDRVDGETIPRKILRDERYARARTGLAVQCGDALARIHRTDVSGVNGLPSASTDALIDQFQAIFDCFDDPRPVFELAFRWLRDNQPEAVAPALVHGDFRNGNFIVDDVGLRAVLDWELAHVGDPFEDLGWICVASWRFGELQLPVGGFGRREELFSAYEAAGGGAVDPDRVRYWEVFGTLKWGVICLMMYGAYKSGVERSVERAAIGRRASEAEIDLLHLLAPLE